MTKDSKADQEMHVAAESLGKPLPGEATSAIEADVTDAEKGPVQNGRRMTVKLRSLAPKFEESEHHSYVRHLEDAIKEPKNRNIALTGRYGAGKSSVLDKFEEKHKGATLRISINTLGPDTEGEGLTNRIQKELVKQLVYRAAPGELRSSRFARVAPLPTKVAFLQSLGATVVVGALLWFVGWLPPVAGTGVANDWYVRILSGLAFAALVVAVVFILRWVVGNRIVSGVTTAGTTVTLQERPDTYFDKYLDEIMSYFDEVSPEYVIFEDLDRFDDPHIFDSLRELNTLINTSALRKDKKHPIRFIYAIKDSLFEQLGSKANDQTQARATQETPEDVGDPASVEPKARVTKEVDAAVAATERANRTKFFELVIPVVPFISHRNARDLLVQAMADLGFPKDLVKRPLLDLVARHATDMRLLVNICNEFGVFAERLLWVEKKAPGIDADHLFALVAYKNFHLADFEAIPQRGSTLDTLEEHLRKLVRAAVKECEDQKRQLLHVGAANRTKQANARRLGDRLIALGEVLRRPAARQYPHTVFTVGGHHLPADKARTYGFWEQASQHRQVTVAASRDSENPATNLVVLTEEDLTTLFGEGLTADRWQELDAKHHQHRLTELDVAVAFLRGADFADLARNDQFRFEGKPFGALIEETLLSELARDLVRRGHIDRNFAEYAARFYGSFVGVDVAFFFNRSVQPNQMYIDYEFSGPASVKNLLGEVPADFTSTVSAFNIDVLSYLLAEADDRANEIVDFLASNFGSDAEEFLNAFLNAAQRPRETLVARLAARPWPQVFTYLITHDGIPDENTRASLVNAALLAAHDVQRYDFDDSVRDYLLETYSKLKSFTDPQTQSQTTTLLSFAHRAGLIVDDLGILGDPLRSRIVHDRMYQLTARNLRTALDIEGAVPLDRIRKVEDVWTFCRDELATYIEAAIGDSKTDHLVENEPVLVEVIAAQHESWTDEELGQIVALSAPGCAVCDLSMVPEKCWPTLARHHRLVPSIANLHRYVDKYGVDRHLADFLTSNTESAAIRTEHDADDEKSRVTLAVAFMNASSVMNPSQRVGLAADLGLPPSAVPVTDVVPTADNLLALALENDLVEDTPEVFEHFSSAGWRAIEKAVAISTKFKDFITPELVSGVVAELLTSDAVPNEIRNVVLKRLAEFVNDDDVPALRAAAQDAGSRRVTLPLTEVRRVAVATEDPDLIVPLLARLRDEPADELVSVLTLLGQPYDLLRSADGGEFDLPTGRPYLILFERLEEDGKVKISSRMFGRGKKVQVLT